MEALEPGVFYRCMSSKITICIWSLQYLMKLFGSDCKSGAFSLSRKPHKSVSQLCQFCYGLLFCKSPKGLGSANGAVLKGTKAWSYAQNL